LYGADAVLGRNQEWKRHEQHTTNIRSHVTLGYHRKQRLVTDQIRLGMVESALAQLNGTPQDHARHEVDALRGCLLAAVVSPTLFHHTVEATAHRFLNAGKLDLATELLCLVGESKQACDILIEAQLWTEAVRVAKAHLHGKAYVEVMCAWAYHLESIGKELDAILVLLSVGCFGRVVHRLLGMGMPDTAACLLLHLRSTFSPQELAVPDALLDVACLSYGKALLLASHVSAACAVLRWSSDVAHFRVLIAHLLAPSRHHVSHKRPGSTRRNRPSNPPHLSSISTGSSSSLMDPQQQAQQTPFHQPSPTMPHPSIQQQHQQQQAQSQSSQPSTLQHAVSHDSFYLKQQLGRVTTQTTSAVTQVIGGKWRSLKALRPSVVGGTSKTSSQQDKP
jgi:hypothetical protein